MPLPKDIRIPLADAKQFGGGLIKVINKYHGEPDNQDTPPVKAEQDEFWISRDLLRHSSRFFQAATKPEWEAIRDENHTVTVAFPDRDIFKAYLHWLHGSTIPCPCSSDLKDEKDQVFLAKLYVLGEELIDVKFKNAVLNTLVLLATYQCPGKETVNVIYKGTPEGSPARRLLADLCTYSARNQAGWSDEYPEYPFDALVDALTVMTRVRLPPSQMQVATGNVRQINPEDYLENID